MKYLILHIDGGLGKNIIATALVKTLKKNYLDYEIIVVSAWEEVWFNNPYIYRFFKFGNLNYFYDDYVKDKDSLIFMQDPYQSTDFIYSKEHLLQTWCKLCGVIYDGESTEIFLTPREIDHVRNVILSDITKPIFLIQPYGGVSTGVPYSWARDIPTGISQEIVNYYSQTYDILQIKRQDQPLLQNAKPLTLGFREIFCTMLFSQKRLLIDSFAQHAAAALNLPSTVLWIVNKPSVFGYSIHNNIVSKTIETYNTTKYSYLQPYNISGTITEYPYNTRDIFNINEIIESL
jgi:hypothetical protein